MKQAEREALLNLLYQQTNVPEYQFRVHWRTNMMSFWDNRLVQHYAARDYLPDRRRIERVTLLGDRPFGEKGASYIVPAAADRDVGGSVDSYQIAAVEREVESKTR